MPEIAEYWARIYAKDDEFKQALTGSENRFRGFAGSMTGIGIGIGTAFAAIGVGVRAVEGVAGVFGGAIMKAADLQESMSKVDTIFKGSSGAVIAYAQTLSDQFGIVRATSLDAMANFGAVLKASGFDEKGAAEMSMKFVKLAGDMSSQMNMPIELAAEKLRAGLVGEAEPLRAVGVLLSETAVKAEAAASGIGSTDRALTEGEKVTARYNIILKQTKDMQGDLERTADSPKNAMRKLSGMMEEFQTNFGAALLPAVTAAMPTIMELAGSLGDFLAGHTDEIKALAQAFAVDLVSAIRSLAKELSGLYADYKEFMAGGGGAILSVLGRVMKEGIWEVSRHPAGEEKSTDIGATDYHPELRVPKKDRPVASGFESETFKSEYEESKKWLAAQITMRNEQKAAEEGQLASTLWGGLQSGLQGLWQGGQIANELFQKAKPIEDFKSSMVDTGGIASQVTQAALSRDDSTKKLQERQTKAAEKAIEFLKPMAEGIKDALIPKFA